MHEVTLGTGDATRLEELVGPDHWAALMRVWDPACKALDGHAVWHVNATATGGGVAEMLAAVLPTWRALGVDARWLVLDGDPEFFAITKRIHNLLHGSRGDGGPLGEAERTAYETSLAPNLDYLRKAVRPGDVVVLHDPQTAGLIPGVAALGVPVIWRSHIGRDQPNEATEVGWAFLAPYLDEATRVIVSRHAYAPPSVPHDRVAIITPCIDPFTPKNVDITEDQASAVLRYAGLLGGSEGGGSRSGAAGEEPGSGDGPEFTRPDGTVGHVRRHPGAIAEGTTLPEDARVVVQVSRWDHLKDMIGVMRGFIDRVREPDAHLVLCGPAVEGVTDDPEGAAVLEECRVAYRALAPEMQERVHLFCIPMDDVDENAFIINALQRHAYTVVQKSLFEGFGLTVTEAMWKGRPVVASRVGGIQDQITDGRNGLLVDPSDLDGMGDAVARLLADPALAKRLGEAARETVIDRFLPTTSMQAYAALLLPILDGH